MLKKEERQRAILNLIESRDISTQEELCALLEEAGFPATQATVSRDIRELSLSKMPSDETGQKYVRIRMSESDMDEKYSRVLRDGYVAMDKAQGLLVLKTVSGMAMAAAAALDECRFHEIVGCIAGDDTIFCAIRSVPETVQVKEKIEDILS